VSDPVLSYIYIQLIGGQTINNFLAALNLDPSLTGSLRIGIHAGGFNGGFSESFINNPPTPGIDDIGPAVPEPSTLVLMALGAVLLGWMNRKSRNEIP